MASGVASMLETHGDFLRLFHGGDLRSQRIEYGDDLQTFDQRAHGCGFVVIVFHRPAK